MTHIQTAKSQLRCHLIITNFTLPASPMFKWANQSKTQVTSHTPPCLVVWIYPAKSSTRSCHGRGMHSGSAPCSAAAPWHITEQNLTPLHVPRAVAFIHRLLSTAQKVPEVLSAIGAEPADSRPAQYFITPGTPRPCQQIDLFLWIVFTSKQSAGQDLTQPIFQNIKTGKWSVSPPGDFRSLV